MSTRSAIVIKESSTSYKGIYCHSDGYPSYVGRMLRDHYTDAGKLNQLINLGSISSLAPEIGHKHDFDASTKLYAKYHNLPNGIKAMYESEEYLDDQKMVRAYGRDRGEKDVYAIVGKSLKAVLGKIDHEYAYVYDVKRARWTVTGHGLRAAELDKAVDDALLIDAVDGIARFEVALETAKGEGDCAEIDRIEKVIADSRATIAKIEAKRADATITALIALDPEPDGPVKAKRFHIVNLTMLVDVEVSLAELQSHFDNGEFAYVVANLAENVRALPIVSESN